MDRSIRTLWIFGPSLTLPWEIPDPTVGWPALVADRLGITSTRHFGTSAVDNFYIYQTFLQNLHEIAPGDLVIVGWSHPNRKMFVLDRDNPVHVAVIDQSHHYVQGEIEFVRSKNPVLDDRNKWSLMKPRDTGKQFYDKWFRDYFNEYEQRRNFQAYYDSVHRRAPGQCLSIFFSKESTHSMLIDPTLFYLDFVIEHKVNLSDSDWHLNPEGHSLFADAIMPFIS